MSVAQPAQTERGVCRVAVIGAGITGLAAAHRLVSRQAELGPAVNLQVTVFEASQRTGGIIQTVQQDGFLIELGPDSFITNKPGAVQLCREIGFADQLIPTDATFRRSLVLRRGRALPVPDGFMLMAPSSPWAILTTPILSWRGRLRLLSEALVPPRRSHDDESLAAFVRRRFGREALDRLVQPLVGGIYTSDPEQLSLQATLPRFPELERQYGSVIRGTLRQKAAAGSARQEDSGSGARYGLFLTARQGLTQLVDAVTQACLQTGRVSLRLGTSIRGITRVSVAGGQAWVLDVLQSPAADLPGGIGHDAAAGAGLAAERAEQALFDAVIVTLPTHAAARLLPASECAELRAALQAIEYASSAIVVSGHRLSDFTEPLDAFGLVIPHQEQRDILAVSFSSRKFPGRAPEGHILLRTFVGGALQPELLQQDDAAILQLVQRELQALLGLHCQPLFARLVRYPGAMPQYHVGHLQRVAAIERACAAHPGLQLAGSAYHGVGIPDSIASGRNAADAILSALSRTPAGAPLPSASDPLHSA